MSFYHWLGIDAEQFEGAEELLEAYGYEADGWITLHPKLGETLCAIGMLGGRMA